MAARFREVAPEKGVDDEESKPKMMVPLDQYNYVLLENGKDHKPDWDKKHIEVKEIKADSGRSDSTAPAVPAGARLFRLKGTKGGLSWMKATSKGETAELVVTVHPRKTVKVAFHFAATGSGDKMQPLTRWNPSDSVQWIKDLNQMYIPQANVAFEKVHADYWVPRKKDAKTGALSDWDPKSSPFNMETRQSGEAWQAVFQETAEFLGSDT